MQALAVIRAAPMPSLPVFAACALMPVAYVMAAGAGPGAAGAALDAVTVAVLVRLVLQLALKLPPAIGMLRRTAAPAAGLALIGLAAAGLPALLVWLNAAPSAQAIWSAVLLGTGALGVRQVLADLDRPAGRRRMARAARQGLALQSANQVLFAMTCAVLAVSAPEPVWVLYAGPGWLVQYWLMGWVWVAWQWSAAED